MTETVLITGAARRIGRQLALDLAVAGHDIVIHCNTSWNEVNTADDAFGFVIVYV